MLLVQRSYCLYRYITEIIFEIQGRRTKSQYKLTRFSKQDPIKHLRFYAVCPCFNATIRLLQCYTSSSPFLISFLSRHTAKPETFTYLGVGQS